MSTRRVARGRSLPHPGRWSRPSFLHLAAASALLSAACGGDGPGYAGSPEDDHLIGEIGAWERTEPVYDQTLYVRPPGQTYGAGDGSSWADALSGLPASLERGARYLLAGGEYYEGPDPEQYEHHVFDDPEDGARFIGLYKATLADHGDETGWEASFAGAPARFGPFSFVTGYYVIDGREGRGAAGHGIRVSTRDCATRDAEFVASPIFFPWDSETTHLALRHLDIEDCGSHTDPTIRSQDAIYTVNPVSQFVVRGCHIHDAWRVLVFLQDSFDVLIEDSHLARAGLHHESSAIALRNTRNVVIRRNTVVDAQMVFVSLQRTRNVIVSSNVFVTTLPDWDVWAAIHSGAPERNVLIAGNTFYGLTGLNTGVRFDDAETASLEVANNLWAGCQTNQIQLDGNHHHNAFYDNWRVDGAEPVSLDDRIAEDTADILTADPFVDAEGLDFCLAAPTAPGAALTAPFADTDLHGETRGADGAWDRGACEYEE